MDFASRDINQIIEDLENGVRNIFESNKYKHYLEVMSKFHNYSANNWKLIYEQCPNATLLAGYVQWKNDFGRYVKKGEKAIRILAPNKCYGYREVCVFDLSQTEGNPLPDDGIVVYKLNGNLENYSVLYNALVNISPLPIYFDNFDDKDGVCYIGEKIVINKEMSEPQILLTILHEITHEILHKNSYDREDIEEVEAESVAYAVCSYLGIDTSRNSFGYIAGYSNNISHWSKQQPIETLNKSLDTIINTTRELITKIRIELGLKPLKEGGTNMYCYEEPALLFKEGIRLFNGNGVEKDYETAFKYFEMAANCGYEDAVYKVAFCYEYGYGIKISYADAYKWYLKIPSNKYAQNKIGYFLANGLGVEKDIKEAFCWFMKSALQGNRVSEYNIGLYYKYGFGDIEKDEEAAFCWFMESALKKLSLAEYNVGLYYKYGYGNVEKNEEEAFYWFSKSAEQGLVSAQVAVGVCHQLGTGTEKDVSKAFECFIEAAEQNNKTAQFLVAKCYENGIGTEYDKSKAFAWYLKAAEQGHKESQYLVAKYYEDGIGTEDDKYEAFAWYLKAAEQGHKESQYLVAKYYENGTGTSENEYKAFDWYLKASEQGHKEAQYTTAVCYCYGIGVDANDYEAFKWYLKAAEQGHTEAQYKVARCYDNACGVEQDASKAFEWYLKVAKQGYNEAKYRVAQCYEEGYGTSSDLEKAFKIYNELKLLKYKGVTFRLSRFYLNGWGIEKDLQLGVDLLLEAFGEGDGNARQLILNSFIELDVYNQQEKFNKRLFEIFS